MNVGREMLAVMAIILGGVMALSHNTKGDLVVGTVMAVAGACFLFMCARQKHR